MGKRFAAESGSVATQEIQEIEYYIGVDPGAEGAVVALDDIGIWTECLAFSTATTKNIRDFLVKYPPEKTYLLFEHVHAMPRSGCGANFTFGFNTGLVTGVIESLGFQVNHIAPQKWQKKFIHAVADRKVRKNLLHVVAKEKFGPRVTKYAADAWLIALYARTQQNPTS